MFLIKTFLTILISAQLAHADSLYEINNSDLPKPTPPTLPPTQPPQQPQPPSEKQYEGVGLLEQVTREKGGDIYRLDLAKALPLSRIEAKSKLGRLKIYAVNLITEKNEKIPVRQLSGINIDEPLPPTSSELFDVRIPVTSVEILAEAMGGEAALEVKVFSPKEAPKLNAGNRIPAFSCKKNIDTILKDKLDPVQLWVSRAESSTPGSVQEKFAGNQLKEQIREFILNLKMSGTYTSTGYLNTLLNFFGDQLNSVRLGGVAEPAYRELLNATYEVLLISIQNEIPCRRYPSDSLIKMAVELYTKHEAMPNEARSRAFFNAAMTKIRDFAPDQYRKELASINMTFKDADSEGVKYYLQFLKAKDGEFLKETHKNMSVYAFVVAEQSLKREVKLMDIEQRYQLIVEYQAKYNANADFPQAVAARYLNILAEETFGYKFFD